MTETITLDPAEVATGRTALDITPWIKVDGVDWGDAEITQYLAEANRGQVPVDYRVPNRTIQIPLVIKALGGTAFSTVRTNFQAKAALIQREGGWIKRITSNGGTVYADLTNATLRLPGSWAQAHKDYDVEATLVLEAIPDFYGNEIQLADHVETTNPEIIFTETGIKGDYPGRVRIVVDEDDADAQLTMIWGFRSKNYSSASTARLAYEAEALEPMSPAAGTVLSGASGGTVVNHGALTGTWQRVLGTRIGGTAGTYMTHVGSYRVWARMRGTSVVAPVEARLLWDVGDLSNPEVNTPWTLTGGSAFYLADLGEIRLDPAPVGTHRWYGQIQARGPSGFTSNLQVDRIWFQPLDEFAGRARVPPTTPEEGVADFLGPRFAGSATTDATAPSGVTVWSNPTNVFASDDARATAALTVATGGHTNFLKATNFGFAVPSGATINGIVVRVEHSATGGIGANTAGDVYVYIVKGGSIMTTVNKAIGVYWPTSDTVATYGSSTDLWGQTWTVADINASNFGFAQTASMGSSNDTTARIDAITITVYYTATGAWVPPADAVMAASQSAELRTEGIFREDSTGVAWSKVTEVTGDLPRIPPAGIEARTCEVLIKSSRSNLDTIADAGIDDISARVNYRPSWLIVPGT